MADGRDYPADVCGIDEALDIAVLKINRQVLRPFAFTV